jgi:CRP/FNR family transcriptional regulator, cyclic AMP receptor protein
MKSLSEHLRATLWANTLTDKQLRRVEADVEEQLCAAGTSVCRKGEAVDAWIGVLEGLVKIHTVSADGRPLTFTGVPAGGWLGEGSLLKSDPRKYDVLALRDSRIARMPRATFEWLIDNSIGFNRFLLRQLNERLAQFIALIEYERLLDTDARVARCLGELFNPILYPGIGPRLSISQEEIGYLTGLSRQRVNQALRKLETEGLLAVEYGGVRVLDLDALRRYGA